MKIRLPVKLFTITVLTTALTVACAEAPDKEAAGGGSKANPEAIAAIKNASDAIKAAKANDWIWRDTESFLQQAREAADKGDNDVAIQLADKARFEAEAAVTQYNYEKDHPRGL